MKPVKKTRNKAVPTQPGRNGGTLLAGSHGGETGRPKGVRNRSTVLKEFLEATLKTKNPITGKDEDLTVEQRMALSMIAQVLTKGNVQAWNSIKDDVYGKITDKVESNVTITDLDITPEQRREALKRILNAKRS